MFILFLIQELSVAEIRQGPLLLSLRLVSVSGLTCTTTGKHAFVAFPVEIRPGSLFPVTATCQPLVCVQPAKLPRLSTGWLRAAGTALNGMLLMSGAGTV